MTNLQTLNDIELRMWIVSIVYTLAYPLSGPMINGEAGRRINIEIITTDSSLSRWEVAPNVSRPTSLTMSQGHIIPPFFIYDGHKPY